MINDGLVRKDHLGRLLPGNSFGEIPMAGLVTAGLPRTAEEELPESINLDDFLIEKKGSTYMLEVDGDSMIDAHIEKGDMVLVERANSAKDGDIVIAEVDGDFTMKYLRHRTVNGKRSEDTWLEPANKNYKPIYPENSFHIIGIVKAVIRKY